ncbi:hypothetical protein [Rhodoblastus sp.]|uniref:hypothetical protein n=1 Tax=Rhodoblastus sp. TaxID=1962975 RepID=UPI003F97E8D4
MSLFAFFFVAICLVFFLGALRRPGEPLRALGFRAGKWLLGAAVVLAALAAIYRTATPSTSLNYKLSVDVDDNGIPRHGEGVIKVVFQSMGPLLIDNTPQWAIGVVGEAFPVDLGARGAFFVLLSRDRTRDTSSGAGRDALGSYFNFYVNDLPNGSGSIAKMNALGASHAATDIKPDQLPTLVRLRDINNPKTVEIVDPDQLDLSFGPGVRIVKARAEITDEPVTKGIRKQLSWLKEGYWEKWIFDPHGEPANQVPLQRQITYGDFATSDFWGGR